MSEREELVVTDESEAALLGELLECLSMVDDPRKARGKRYPLIEVLSIAVLGCVCGCDHAEALEDWAKKESDWLRELLELRHGTPSQDVFLRVFAALDPVQFRAAFMAWMRRVFEVLGLEGQIAVDGQTHRGSRDRGSGGKPIHMVHAFACESGLVLGGLPTEKKSNEIRAIPRLLELLDLRGALVSIDAMGAQVQIAQEICRKGGDYLLGLKGNQSNLHQEVSEVFTQALRPASHNIDQATPPTVETATEVNGGHGRIETRVAHVISAFGKWVPAAEMWRGLKCLIAIVATREEVIGGKTSQETRYYISSRQMTAEQAMRAVRSHWLVENQLHWVLDVTFGQDHNQTRTAHAAENLAVVRHFALNLVRNYSGDRRSLPRRRRLCDYDRDYRDQVLAAATAS